MLLDQNDFLALRAQSDKWKAFLAEEQTSLDHFLPQYQKWPAVKKRLYKHYWGEVKEGAIYDGSLYLLLSLVVLYVTQSGLLFCAAFLFFAQIFFNRATALWQECWESYDAEVNEHQRFAYRKTIEVMCRYADMYQVDIFLLENIINSLVTVENLNEIEVFIEEYGFEAEYDLIKRIHTRIAQLY